MIKANKPTVISFYSVFIMQCRMLFESTRNQLKVFNSIVKLNSIDVMNYLLRCKQSSNMFFHNKSMFRYIIMSIPVWMSFAQNKNRTIFRVICLNTPTLPSKMILSSFLGSKILPSHCGSTLHRTKMMTTCCLFFKVAWISLMRLATHVTNKGKFFNCFWSACPSHYLIISQRCLFVNKSWRVVNHV